MSQAVRLLLPQARFPAPILSLGRIPRVLHRLQESEDIDLAEICIARLLVWNVHSRTFIPGGCRSRLAFSTPDLSILATGLRSVYNKD